jgi:hypothetical protein
MSENQRRASTALLDDIGLRDAEKAELAGHDWTTTRRHASVQKQDFSFKGTHNMYFISRDFEAEI